MKKTTVKKLSLGKIKIASLSNASQEALKGGVGLVSVRCTIKLCTDNISQGAPICSVDSCRY